MEQEIMNQREKDGYPDVSLKKCPSCCEKYLDIDFRKCDDSSEEICIYCYEDLVANSV